VAVLARRRLCLRAACLWHPGEAVQSVQRASKRLLDTRLFDAGDYHLAVCRETDLLFDVGVVKSELSLLEPFHNDGQFSIARKPLAGTRRRDFCKS